MTTATTEETQEEILTEEEQVVFSEEEIVDFGSVKSNKTVETQEEALRGISFNEDEEEDKLEYDLDDEEMCMPPCFNASGRRCKTAITTKGPRDHRAKCFRNAYLIAVVFFVFAMPFAIWFLVWLNRDNDRP